MSPYDKHKRNQAVLTWVNYQLPFLDNFKLYIQLSVLSCLVLIRPWTLAHDHILGGQSKEIETSARKQRREGERFDVSGAQEREIPLP